MKTKWIAGAATLCAGIGLFAMSATAADAASVSGCLHAAKDVRAAIAGNQSSPKLEDAQRQQRYGLEYCNQGFYKQGMAHYAEALKVLGADAKS